MADYLVIDIGGTFIKYALADENGIFLEHDKVPSPQDSRESFFEALYGICDHYKGKVEGVAVSMPGRIDTKSGLAITAGALTSILQNCPVGPMLEEHCGLPVVVGNDGKCAAAAEAWSGALKDCSNGMVVVYGTGTGGGIVIDHKVYMGSHFAAGELSNFIYDGPLVQEGYVFGSQREFEERSPRWEAYASARRLLYEYKRRIGVPYDADISGETFFERLRAGEKEAVETLRFEADGVAVGMLTLQTLFDLEVYAIGGGISEAPELIPAIQESVHRYFSKYTDRMPLIEPLVVKCHYGAEANLIGALKLFKETLGIN